MELFSTPSNLSQMCVTSFVAARHPGESCGNNGLPLTPNSVAILGQAQTLKVLTSSSSNNLCVFLDCLRGKHERVAVVAEHFKTTLKDMVVSDDKADVDLMWSVAEGIFRGLDVLHKEGFAHVCLDMSNVLLDDFNVIKLFNYWLGHMTAYGSYVSFPIFNPRFVAPEVLLLGPTTEGRSMDDLIRETEKPCDSCLLDLKLFR